MKKKKIISISKLLKSFKYAFNGLRILFLGEQNARIHFAISICVIIAGFVFTISLYEWIALFFAIGLVFSLEIINTSIEELSDIVSPERNEKIKKTKDLAAAGVLISAICAAIIGLIIFIPKIIFLFD